MTTWRWLEGGQLTASCETFRLPSRVSGAPGQSWSVASVFVERRLRGQGHASRMLASLTERLSGEAGAQAVVLFSEVGAGIYERLGFVAVPSWDVCFAPRPDAPETSPSASRAPLVRAPVDLSTHAPRSLPGLTGPSNPSPWPSPQLGEARERELGAPRQPGLPADRVQLTAAPAQPPSLSDAPQTLVIAASADEADWHLERERCYSDALGLPALEHHGARLGDSTIAWAAYHRTRELHVLWLDAKEPAHRAPLIHAAQHAAHAAGLSTVRVWETTPLDDVPGGRRVRRDDALPMFAPLVPGISAPACAWTQVHRALWV